MSSSRQPAYQLGRRGTEEQQQAVCQLARGAATGNLPASKPKKRKQQPASQPEGQQEAAGQHHKNIFSEDYAKTPSSKNCEENLFSRDYAKNLFNKEDMPQCPRSIVVMSPRRSAWLYPGNTAMTW